MSENIMVLIPAAGKGKRLYPYTLSKPKTLIPIGGKPILGHIIDEIPEYLNRIVIITGQQNDYIREYLREEYVDGDHEFKLVEQKVPLGLGHAVYTGKQAVEEAPLVIILGDELIKYDIDFREFAEDGADGYIGVKTVDVPSLYGIVYTEGEYITKMVEKPDHSDSNIGIAGIYFIKNTKMLFDTLEEMVTNNELNKGEIQFTDALQKMVLNGAKFKFFMVNEWYDCGRVDMLLKVNRAVLDKMKGSVELKDGNSIIIPPVFLGDGTVISNSIIGPYVSIGKESRIENSIMTDTVVDIGGDIANMILEGSLVGEYVKLQGTPRKVYAGDFTKIKF